MTDMDKGSSSEGNNGGGDGKTGVYVTSDEPLPRLVAVSDVYAASASDVATTTATAAVVASASATASSHDKTPLHAPAGDACASSFTPLPLTQEQQPPPPPPNYDYYYDYSNPQHPPPPPPPPRKRVLGRFRRVGCLVCAFDAWHAVLVSLPIIAATALFLSSVVPHAEVYSYVVVGVLAVTALLCLLLTVGVDPGIVPPAPAPAPLPPLHLQLPPQPPAAAATGGAAAPPPPYQPPPYQPPPPPETVAVLVRGSVVVCKVCPTCHVLRPPRCSHCRFCDVCVEEFDHHCRVVGGCVGRRTLRFFTGFLVFSTLLGVYIFVRTAVVLARLDAAAARAAPGGRWRIAACALCLAICVFFCPLVAPCGLQYVYFACLNVTQKELLRSRRPCALNRPYHRGFCANVLHRFCAPLGRSRVRGSAEYV